MIVVAILSNINEYSYVLAWTMFVAYADLILEVGRYSTVGSRCDMGPVICGTVVDKSKEIIVHEKAPTTIYYEYLGSALNIQPWN